MKKCAYCKQPVCTGQRFVEFRKPNRRGKFSGELEYFHRDCWTIVRRAEAAEAEHRPAWDKIFPTTMAEIDSIKE